MPPIPRILRKVPQGAIIQAPQPVPVLAEIQWADGQVDEVPAIVCAWTADAVEVFWEAPLEGLRSDWLPVSSVRRSKLSPLSPRAEAPTSDVTRRYTRG